jgi:histone deacetylase complex regulatory component SIN3
LHITDSLIIEQERYESQPETLQRFMNLLHSYQHHSKPSREVYEEIHHLFSSTPDLIQDFQIFLPHSHEDHQPKASATKTYNKADVGAKAESLENAMYPSVGACDEFMPVFLCQKRLTRRHMNWLKGKATGLRDEGESITLKLVPLDTAWREGARDAKVLAALALYDNLKREGRVPGMPRRVAAEPEDLITG